MAKIKRIVDKGPDPSMPPGVPYDTGFIEMEDGRYVPLTATNHDRASWATIGKGFIANEEYMARLPAGRPIPKAYDPYAPGGEYDTRGT